MTTGMLPLFRYSNGFHLFSLPFSFKCNQVPHTMALIVIGQWPHIVTHPSTNTNAHAHEPTNLNIISFGKNYRIPYNIFFFTLNSPNRIPERKLTTLIDALKAYISNAFQRRQRPMSICF